ncbi:aspartyl/asparaginyl beta-hydroxylase isoform X4 [Bufo gargarizans]|uniref:aspartyl/asparaginyl beta-hydroxylase isoform X4 n=1 Tax=Bufo gargarizans TaxID=30331 RepID=UPI001CF2B085|nr:aspartyl/asparaginyl beta-hydroxylase isoform X4 [Bufo gargarizans]
MPSKKAKSVRRDQKHGGKNGKKEGLSGSSFFTWFMVIALLGVWTSVAVVWFDLVDYEEFIGKLGDYDADGDGDFDVDDAKVLLGFAQSPITEKATKAPDIAGGITKTKSKAEVKEGIKEQLKKVKEKFVGHDQEQSKEKPPKESDREKKPVEKSESRSKRDEKPRETTRRTASGRTSSGDRGKKTETKVDK